MSSIRVLYDYPAFSATHNGVSRYVCEIIKEFNTEIEVEMSVLVSDNLYLEELPFLKIKHFLKNKKFKGKEKAERIINTLYSNYKVIRNNYDIFHATYSDPYFLTKVKKPLVVTIHDMINEKFPEYHASHAKHIASKKKLIFNSSHIIAISENTKKNILELYPVDPDKISVIHHGAPVGLKSFLINEFGEFILYVGRRTRYKKFRFFVQSIAPLLIENSNLKLVCTGTSFTPDEEKFLIESGIRKQVIAVSASDELLYSLYRNALVFVFPSKFEGFGIPILEAFANNCPVCLSNSSCFPEIAGNAALYFNPDDADSIYDNVKKIITDKKLASELVKRGAERLPLFSWSSAAQKTLDVYKKIV
jgi:glycosyltransferase involved in cell wall biosynthesis